MAFILFLPEEKKIPAELNKSILDIAFNNDIILEHICGGVCACNSCLIFIHNGIEFFNDVTEQELFNLKKSPLFTKNARLACSAMITKLPEKDIVIEIPVFNNTNDL